MLLQTTRVMCLLIPYLFYIGKPAIIYQREIMTSAIKTSSQDKSWSNSDR